DRRTIEVVLVLDELQRVLVAARISLQRLERIRRRRDEDEDQKARDRKDGDRIQKPAKDVSRHAVPSLEGPRSRPERGGTSCLEVPTLLPLGRNPVDVVEEGLAGRVLLEVLPLRPEHEPSRLLVQRNDRKVLRDLCRGLVEQLGLQSGVERRVHALEQTRHLRVAVTLVV